MLTEHQRERVVSIVQDACLVLKERLIGCRFVRPFAFRLAEFEQSEKVQARDEVARADPR